MGRWYWVAAACLLHVGPVLAVNKCVDKNGKVTFQDAPCSVESKTQEKVKVWEQGTTRSGLVYPVEKLDLRGTSDKKLNVASAAMENLADMSSDCKIKLQVYGMKGEALAACDRFLSHHKEWWSPLTNTLKQLMEDREWGVANMDKISNVTRFMAKINENTEFIGIRIGAPR